jgi:aminopeptidase N
MEDSLARALIWGAAWDMTRDAEMSAGDYVDLAISGLRREGDIGVVSMTVRQLGSVIEQFAAPANRDAYRDRIALAFKDYALAAEAGSDHQLAFLRGFMANARSSEDQRWLTALLDGTEQVEGLAVDADLRWSIVTRLVALRASEALIDDELTRDDTATGRRHAALARAARPTVEAKESAWAAAVEGDELSNAILGATVGGFNQPDQRDLLRPFVDKYVAALPGIWSERTYETASTLTMGLFAASLVEPATIAAADALLANESLAPGGRRLVGELRDGVQRAARAQEMDAGRAN